MGYNGSIAATRVLAQQQNVLSKPYSNIAKALEDLQNQNIEGVVMDYLPAIGYCNNLYKNILKIVPQLLTDESIHLVTLRKSPTPLTEKFNAGLQAMRENGSYEALRDKWKLK